MTHSTRQKETRWRTRWYVAPLVDAHIIERKRRKCKSAGRWEVVVPGGERRNRKRSKTQHETCWALQGDDAALCLRQWRRSVIRHTRTLCVRHYAMREPTYLPWRNFMTGWSSVLCVATKPKHYLSCDYQSCKKWVRCCDYIANYFSQEKNIHIILIFKYKEGKIRISFFVNLGTRNLLSVLDIKFY